MMGPRYSPSMITAGLYAELVARPEGFSGCNDTAYAGPNVTGKMVLVERWRCDTGGPIAGRVRPAARAGAAAVVAYSNSAENVTGFTISAPSPTLCPTGIINRSVRSPDQGPFIIIITIQRHQQTNKIPGLFPADADH